MSMLYTDARRKGNWAVFATLRGSYGETVHRMVGAQYVKLENAAQKALDLYSVKGNRGNVEIVDLRTGRRVDARDLADAMATYTRNASSATAKRGA
jgi:hypothetical protein